LTNLRERSIQQPRNYLSSFDVSVLSFTLSNTLFTLSPAAALMSSAWSYY
jgi:hypothetical protein